MPDKLGRRQRTLLVNMVRFGRGHWPPGWYMSYADAEVMVSLHKRGLVTTVGKNAALTKKGQLTAKTLL